MTGIVCNKYGLSKVLVDRAGCLAVNTSAQKGMTMFRKRLISLVACLLLLFSLLLAGCDSPSSMGSGDSASSSSLSKSEAIEDAGGYTSEATRAGIEGGAADTTAAQSRKIIRDADITCSANDVQKAYQVVLVWLQKHGGYEQSKQMDTRDDYCTINAVFKIAPEKLDDFLKAVDENTEVINQNVSASDITEDYFDVQLRLKSKKAALDRYYILLEKAKTVEEILAIQQTINDYTTEIESMEGKLMFWDKQVSESTVTISFFQTNDPSKPKEVSFEALSFGTMFKYIGNGFTSVVNVLVAVLQWLLIALLSLLPLIVFVLVIVFIIWWLVKRSKNKKQPLE